MAYTQAEIEKMRSEGKSQPPTGTVEAAGHIIKNFNKEISGVPTQANIEKRLTTELSKLLYSLSSGDINTQQAKLQLHEWFRALSDEEQLELYQNEKGKKIAQRISNYGLTLFNEIPVLMSMVKL